MASLPPPPSSYDSNPEFYEEGWVKKLGRRMKEEPLIPLGCALTSYALYAASRSIRAGDSNRTNRLFRRRIYAQGFTVAAMLGGSIYWAEDRERRAKFDKLLAEKIHLEKRDAWLKELEARELEEEELRRRAERARQRNSREKSRQAPQDSLSTGVVDKAKDLAFGKA